MQRHLPAVLILVAAVVFYGAGMVGGASVLFMAGFACEFWFWIRMQARRRHA
jgi:hypothetical protein